MSIQRTDAVRDGQTRRDFLRAVGFGAAVAAGGLPARRLPAAEAPAPTGAPAPAGARGKDKRPNILFAFADDWSWPFASIAGDETDRKFDFAATPGAGGRLCREAGGFRKLMERVAEKC
jgi:hypothetical protein